jgi:anti-sigma regulatory factor (Ser/Thr protein kinase)
MCEHTTLPAPDIAHMLVRQCERSFPGRADQVREARVLISGLLDGCSAADDVVLLVSELAANAIAHSASGQPGGTFTVRARVCGASWVHAEVEDQGSAWNGNIGAAQCPHGLYLLRELSSDCGSRHGEHGWLIWFTIGSPQRAVHP